MPAVYLDGVELESDFMRLVIQAIGNLSETCRQCGGSMLHVRTIFLHSSDEPPVFCTWCRTCGYYDRLSQDYPTAWRHRLLSKVRRSQYPG